jgi:hypothetical protein
MQSAMPAHSRTFEHRELFFPVTAAKKRVWLRHSLWDTLFILLALVHGGLVLWTPSIPLIALGLWWSSNTVAHNFIHLPFFRSKQWNVFFSAYLSLVIGIPQRLWRDRHLAHHAEANWRLTWSPQLIFETVLIASAWILMIAWEPQFFLKTYLPGYFIGLGLCQLQGYFEHAHGTTSHYGRLYNLLFFNDGFHIEHHACPWLHWRELPRTKRSGENTSRWPAVLRWLEYSQIRSNERTSFAPVPEPNAAQPPVFHPTIWSVSLDSLERLVLRFAFLQKFVLERHERAFQKLLGHLTNVRQITIVGGGLFPRSALIARRLFPEAEITVIEARPQNIEAARAFIGEGVRYVHQLYETASETFHADLLIVPLAFLGDRREIYRTSNARHVLVHDWIWRRRGRSVVISWPLLKRFNLIQP